MPARTQKLSALFPLQYVNLLRMMAAGRGISLAAMLRLVVGRFLEECERRGEEEFGWVFDEGGARPLLQTDPPPLSAQRHEPARIPDDWEPSPDEIRAIVRDVFRQRIPGIPSAETRQKILRRLHGDDTAPEDASGML